MIILIMNKRKIHSKWIIRSVHYCIEYSLFFNFKDFVSPISTEIYIYMCVNDVYLC